MRGAFYFYLLNSFAYKNDVSKQVFSEQKTATGSQIFSCKYWKYSNNFDAGVEGDEGSA